jgi:Flp pilus assembly pilin Flp
VSAARSIFRLKVRNLLFGQSGQDLVEYALAVSMIALAAISGISKVATAVNSALSNVSTSLAPAQHHGDDD